MVTDQPSTSFSDVRMKGPSSPVETSTSFTYSNSFTTATRKKKKRRAGRNVTAPTPQELVERTRAEMLLDPAWLERAIASILDTIQGLPDDGDGIDVVCLGLGSPVASFQARFQLCFLLELLKKNELSIRSIEAFDPAFSSEDKTLLESFAVRISADDKKGAYVLTRRTVAYMPHCEFRIYENLLRANWTSQRLARLVIVGNTFEDYADSPKFDLKKEAPCMHRLVPLINAVPLEAHATHRVAFSGTTIQSVDFMALPSESVSVTGPNKEEEEGRKAVDASSSFQPVEFWNPAPPVLKGEHVS